MGVDMLDVAFRIAKSFRMKVLRGAALERLWAGWKDFTIGELHDFVCHGFTGDRSRPQQRTMIPKTSSSRKPFVWNS